MTDWLKELRKYDTAKFAEEYAVAVMPPQPQPANQNPVYVLQKLDDDGETLLAMWVTTFGCSTEPMQAQKFATMEEAIASAPGAGWQVVCWREAKA